MSFSIRNLSVLAYANGFTLWHYKAPGERRDEVARRGFFDAAGDMLALGDIVLVSAADGGKMLSVTGDRENVAVAAMA